MNTLIFVISSLSGGGAERVLSQLANHWVVQGLSVTVITLNSPEDTDAYPLNPLISRRYVTLLNSESKFDTFLKLFHAARSIRSIVKATSAPVVLSFMTSTNLLTIFATRGLGIRTVISERTDPRLQQLPLFWTLSRKFFYRFADLVIVQTLAIRTWLEKECKVKAAVIPNFVDRSSFSVPRNRDPQNAVCVLAVGRLHHEKGFDILIQAFSMLLPKCPECKLVILGEGDERSKLQGLIDGLGINHAIELKGFVHNPHTLMAQASIAVQPSRCEGFPNALLEAMSLGLPVLATQTAGGMLVTNDVNGLLVPSEDPEKMATALLRLIESPDLRRRLGIEAEKVNIQYSKEAVLDLWEASLNIQGTSA